ncbi:MAG: hypothetical protein JW864_16715 [Spirochaetes bacterium]|nr:hypothetical protein [Spirochaetota bacterium]
MSESRYSRYIVTDLQSPDFGTDYTDNYKKFAKRILWIDDKVVPGSFQMNCSWYLKPNDFHSSNSHAHDEDEILGFIGSDPDNPYDLGAEIEFWIEDEKFMLTRSCMIFLPGGMVHCPLVIHRVDRPVFHYSVITGGAYTVK